MDTIGQNVQNEQNEKKAPGKEFIKKKRKKAYGHASVALILQFIIASAAQGGVWRYFRDRDKDPVTAR